MTIRVRNLQRRQRVGIARLQGFAERALQLCVQISRRSPTALKTLEVVEVLVISDRRMAALHRRFLNIAGPTDVLTFEHGELFLSADTARANGERFHTSMEHELQLYVVHGLLHLHGFDDTTPAKAKRMTAVQEKVFAAAAGGR